MSDFWGAYQKFSSNFFDDQTSLLFYVQIMHYFPHKLKNPTQHYAESDFY
nr:MAG TPA: hypothetical protein [Caudoviricetes sp.]